MLEPSILQELYSLFPTIWTGAAEQDHYGTVYLRGRGGENLVMMCREDYDQLMQYKEEHEYRF